MPAGGAHQPTDAVTAARFSITIDGVEVAQFSELTGITTEIEAVEFSGRTPQKAPARRKPPTVTLKRGMNKDMGIFAWHQSVVEGQIAAARKSCTLTMYDTAGTATAKYYLENAWPTKVEIGTVKAGSSEVLYETVTLTCENIQRVAP
jgi:phage tail-like protein